MQNIISKTWTGKNINWRGDGNEIIPRSTCERDDRQISSKEKYQEEKDDQEIATREDEYLQERDDRQISSREKYWEEKGDMKITTREEWTCER